MRDQDIKTEYTRKLSNFNFQWTKTLYQNDLKNVAYFSTFFKNLRCYFVIFNNTKENFSWESKKTNVKFHKNCENTGKILKICIGNSMISIDIWHKYHK